MRWATAASADELPVTPIASKSSLSLVSGHPRTDRDRPFTGARHVDSRVVQDRNQMTGTGATAGIDFALALVASMKGEDVARRVQLGSGTPAEANPERTAAMRESRKWMDDQARSAAEMRADGLGLTHREWRES